MSREWKAGDVAWVNGTRAVRADHVWHTKSGILSDRNVHMVRPLVVIDPEDREQVERLAREYVRTFAPASHLDPTAVTKAATQLQTALREYVDPKPPKPDEPTGLGAVVEDAEGVRWTRCDDIGTPWWGQGPGWASWSAIDAVRVLSEGVVPS